MSLAYIRKVYGVPSKRGSRVTYDGKPGRITGSSGPYLRVKLDGRKHAAIYHPTWNIVYLEDTPDDH